MCGIAGAIVSRNELPDIFLCAVSACRTRGEDSFGLLRWSPDYGWKELRRLSCSLEECVAFFDDGSPPPHYYLHTSRAEPTTEFQPQKTEADIPPFRDGDIAVAHNGIIANDRELAFRFEIRTRSRIDTAILPPLVERLGFWNAIAQLRGGSALAAIDARSGSMYLARSFLPLTVAWRPGILVFASEARFFPGSEDPFPPYRRWDMPPFMGIEFSPLGYRNPIPWGDIPSAKSHDGWRSFPDV